MARNIEIKARAADLDAMRARAAAIADQGPVEIPQDDTGRTRIHLDRVEGLGSFLELEVVLADDEPPANGVAEAHRLMERLGITSALLVEGAYVDLLRKTP